MHRAEPERPLEPRDIPLPRCPVCGAEGPEKIIREPGGPVLGCDLCLCLYDAWAYFDGQEDCDGR